MVSSDPLDPDFEPNSWQKKEVEDLIADTSKYWVVDFPKQTIKRKQLGLREKMKYLTGKRQSVRALYFYIRKMQSTEEGMPFPDVMDHDNLPIPGFPIKYTLKSPYKIERKDQKWLNKGPLYSQTERKVIVAAKSKRRIKSILKWSFNHAAGGIISFLAVALLTWWLTAAQ
jgi:hypothetical protein